MTDDKLKPCPFCGGKADLHWHWSDCWGTICLSCCIEGPIPKQDTEAEAITAWNQRATDTQVSSLVSAAMDFKKAREAWAAVFPSSKAEAHIAEADVAMKAMFAALDGILSKSDA